jgi:PAS domain S-box-containing protein
LGSLRVNVGFRTMLAFLLFAFSLVPAGGAVLLTASAKQQEAEATLDARLAETSRNAEFALANDLERFRQILLTSAQNPALVGVPPGTRRPEAQRRAVNAALLHLTTVFPGMIDEACWIDPMGVEQARVVKGVVSDEADLSPDESGNPFFRPTVVLPRGLVHFHVQYRSPDTDRWVLSASTPLRADGTNHGILHFEVPLAYYHRVLKSTLPPDSFLAVVDPEGRVLLDSQAPEPAAEDLAELGTAFPHLQLETADPLDRAGATGYGVWSNASGRYRVRYQHAEPVPGVKLTVLVGLPAVPGFAEQLAPFLVPLVFGGGVVLLVAVAVVMLLPGSLAVRAVPGSITLPRRKRELSGWFVLLVALVVALAAAVGATALHRSSARLRRSEVVLGRLDGLSRQMTGLAHDIQTAGQAAPQVGAELRELRDRVSRELEELAGFDEGSTPPRVSGAFGQFEADLTELLRLSAENRDAEARVWDQQRVDVSHASLLGAVADAGAIYRAAAERADLAADVGSASGMVFTAVLMALLFRRFEQARRAAEILATEQRARRQGQERYESLVRNASDVVAILAPDGTTRYCSPAAERVWGCPPEPFEGSNAFDLVHPEDRAAARGTVEQALGSPGTNITRELRLRHADGSWRDFEVVATNLLDQPEVGGVVVTYRDITERNRAAASLRETNRRLTETLSELKDTQQRVIQHERLRALGQMASGIAHDFNNQLGLILGYSDLLLHQPGMLDDRGVVTEALETVHTAARDAAAVVHGLRAFYRPADDADDARGPVDLAKLLEQVVALTQPRWRDQALARGVGIEIDLDARPVPPIRGGEAELREALINVVFNAVDAMPAGGRLGLRTASDGDRVSVEIADTGVGIPDAVRARIFEPFFTTKGEFGTGLGLAMVHGIVERHRGTVEVESAPDRGTTFVLRFPVLAAGTPATPQSRPEGDVAPCRVLVVDDEPRLRDLAAQMLAAAGHDVRCAADGPEALDLMHGAHFDAVVTDMAMPGMNGAELARAVKAGWPDTAVVLLTGFGGLMNAAGEIPSGVDVVLGKPAGEADLRRALAAAGVRHRTSPAR